MDDSMKEAVEKRAYHLFLKRGGKHGYAMQDWIQAEKEMGEEVATRKKLAASRLSQLQNTTRKKIAS
jgi:hypothetical protein